MVVDTMSYEEIVAEFNKDWINYFPDVIDRHLNDNKYRRFMLKQVLLTTRMTFGLWAALLIMLHPVGADTKLNSL